MTDRVPNIALRHKDVSEVRTSFWLIRGGQKKNKFVCQYDSCTAQYTHISLKPFEVPAELLFVEVKRLFWKLGLR